MLYMEGMCSIWRECALFGGSVLYMEGVCFKWRECVQYGWRECVRYGWREYVWYGWRECALNGGIVLYIVTLRECTQRV